MATLSQQRMYERRVGLFVHYLHSEKGTKLSPDAKYPDDIDVYDWNATVNDFDVPRFAAQIHAMGARYLFFTMMQGRKFMAAPNDTFNRIAEIKPGDGCSFRDLPMELADELAKYDIDLYLYFTGDGPYLSPDCSAKFGFTEKRGDMTDGFAAKWAEVLREYAVRYGNKVKGWWIDGCYRHAFHYTDKQLRMYYDAIKAGSPDQMAAFNVGGFSDPEAIRPALEDFTTGEEGNFTYVPEGRFYENGAQMHVLIPVGVAPDGLDWNSWGRPGLKCGREQMLEHVKKVTAKGCAVTLEAVIYRGGYLDDEQTDAISYVFHHWDEPLKNK